MSAGVLERVYSADDLSKLEDENFYELVDGKLEELDAGAESDIVSGDIHGLLWNYVRSNKQALVFVQGTGFRCFPNSPNKVRRPDVSAICSGRLPNDRPPRGFIDIAPDLAVEVNSPNDLASRISEKIQEYREAGVRLIWIVDPVRRTVQVIRSDAPEVVLGEMDEITGDPVFPDFKVAVSRFFEGLA